MNGNTKGNKNCCSCGNFNIGNWYSCMDIWGTEADLFNGSHRESTSRMAGQMDVREGKEITANGGQASKN